MYNLAIVNKGNPTKGKSSAIIEVWNLIQTKYRNEFNIIEPKKAFYNDKDFTGIVEYRNVRVGICSYGDGAKNLKFAIDNFIKKENDCRILVLACRRRGSNTYNEVKKLEYQGWKICWEQNEHPTDPNEFDECNQKYARKVVDMIISKIAEMNKNKDMCC